MEQHLVEFKAALQQRNMGYLPSELVTKEMLKETIGRIDSVVTHTRDKLVSHMPNSYY